MAKLTPTQKKAKEEALLKNTYYIYYAQVNGYSPELQLKYDKQQGHFGGVEIPFVMWMAEKWRSFRYNKGIADNVPLKQEHYEAFDYFIGLKKRPRGRPKKKKVESGQVWNVIAAQVEDEAQRFEARRLSEPQWEALPDGSIRLIQDTPPPIYVTSSSAYIMSDQERMQRERDRAEQRINESMFRTDGNRPTIFNASGSFNNTLPFSLEPEPPEHIDDDDTPF
jgi:hypothetical protein